MIDRPPTKRLLTQAYSNLYGVVCRKVWSDEDISCSGIVSYTFSVLHHPEFSSVAGESGGNWNMARYHLGWELLERAQTILRDGVVSVDVKRRVRRVVRMLSPYYSSA